jgi:hypothetical protein
MILSLWCWRLVMSERDGQRTAAEALLDASCLAHGLTLADANREMVAANVLALIDAAKVLDACPLPDDVEPATLFRAAP